MPKAFEQCRRQGGKIRTVTLPGGKFMPVCIRPKGRTGPHGGRTVAGEVHKRKSR